MKRLFGGLLLAAGIMIMLLSGLCTLLVSVFGIVAAFQEPTIILFPLVVGGVPFAIGFGLYKWGRWLLHEPTDHNVF